MFQHELIWHENTFFNKFSSLYFNTNPSITLIIIYTVGTESIQTPLHFSLFIILQPFAKII